MAREAGRTSEDLTSPKSVCERNRAEPGSAALDKYIVEIYLAAV